MLLEEQESHNVVEKNYQSSRSCRNCLGKFADNQMEDKSYLIKMVDNNNQEIEPPFRKAQSRSIWCKGQDVPSDISNP